MFAWWSDATEKDIQVVTRQLGKAPRGICAIARRCRFGMPQVVVTSPVVQGPGRRSERVAGVTAHDVRVFPTTYWLTCPYLTTAVGRLEGEGWIGRLHAWLAQSGQEKTMAVAHERAARERIALVEPPWRERLSQEQPAQWSVLMSAGIGGARTKTGVKCLHTHLADYLAGPVGTQRDPQHDNVARNPLGARVLSLLLQRGVDTTGWPQAGTCFCTHDEAPIAILDVGTNSCRLFLAEHEKGHLVRKKAALETTRMGEGLQTTGRLAWPAVSRTITGLRHLLDVAKAHSARPPQVIGIATNAVRSAANPEDFLIPAWEELGVAIRVITGHEEACYSFQGALAGLKDHVHKTTAAVAVLDIGGGSSECVVGGWDGQLTWSGSVDVGAVRLTELAAAMDLPTTVEMAERFLRQELEVARDLLSAGSTLVGVGGTCTTLAAVTMQMVDYNPDRIQGHILTIDQVVHVATMLGAMSAEERGRVPGLQPARADIIVAGTAILWAAMKLLRQKTVVISDTDLMWGVAHQFVNQQAHGYPLKHRT